MIPKSARTLEKEIERELERLQLDYEALGPCDCICVSVSPTKVKKARLYDDDGDIERPAEEVLAKLRAAKTMTWEEFWAKM